MNQEGVIYSVVNKAQQKEALSFLQRHVFENPYWLMDKKILDRIESPTGNDVMSIQESTLANLMSTAKLQRLTYSALRDEKSYRVEDYMDDLKRMVFSDVPSRRIMDSYKRTFQKSYVDKLINLVNPTFQPPTGGGIVITFGPPFDPRKTDITSVAKGTLRSLRSELQSALPGYSDKMSKYHLQDLIDRIDKALKI